MRKINLDNLKNGQSGITPNIGAFLVEAAVFCLMNNGHKSGTILKVKGSFNEEFRLEWDGHLTNQMKQSWKDTREAAEFGATAIAALLIRELLEFEILSRAEQGTGVDYQIGEIDSLEIQAHMEVSGIIKETDRNTINVRVQKKVKQVQKQIGKLPVYVVVSEFAFPKTKIVKND